MDLPTYISFGDELVKIADAGIRANMAARNGAVVGTDYLPGGELESNDPSQTNFVPKLAGKGETTEGKFDSKKLKKKFHKAYNKHREPAGAALRGGFGGAFLGQMLTGGRLGGKGLAARMGLRGFGALGAGAGLADHYAQGKKGRRRRRRRRSVLLDKTAGMPSGTFTPARQLQRGTHTGSFERVVHKGGVLRPPTVGQKFKFPSDPTQ